MIKRKFEVYWSLNSKDDIKKIISYIAKNSPSDAKNIFKEIENQVNHLLEDPERGRIVPELENQGILKYREMIFNPWRIVYTLEKEMVKILIIADGRRDLEDILYKRLIR